MKTINTMICANSANYWHFNGYPKTQNIAYAGTRKGHKACNDDGGHPAPSGRALPNLLMRSVF